MIEKYSTMAIHIMKMVKTKYTQLGKKNIIKAVRLKINTDVIIFFKSIVLQLHALTGIKSFPSLWQSENRAEVSSPKVTDEGGRY